MRLHIIPVFGGGGFVSISVSGAAVKEESALKRGCIAWCTIVNQIHARTIQRLNTQTIQLKLLMMKAFMRWLCPGSTITVFRRGGRA